jgi:NitT/TauT family transport system substrate-binding protein
MYRRIQGLVLLLAIALVVAACGSGTETSDTTEGEVPETTTAPEEEATTTAEEGGGDTTAPAEEEPEEDVEMETVRVAIGNLRAIQYFPIYLADAGGYFEDEGIEVELEVISGSGAVVQQLIAGNTDIMLSNPAAAINAVANEQGDIVTYCSTHYQNIFGLATPESTGITDVAGLEGETVGISEASGGEVPVVRAALATAGLADGEDYELLPIGEGGQVTFQALSSGDAAAYSSSVFDVASVEAAGLPLVQILPEEFLYVPSIAFSVMRPTFEENGDLLARFARAQARAYEWGRQPENREAVNELISPYNPELFEDPAFVDAVWEATLNLMTPPDDMSDAPLCSHYFPGWETYVAAALETPVDEGGLAADVDIEAMADESLIPEINDFTEEDLEPPNAG